MVATCFNTDSDLACSCSGLCKRLSTRTIKNPGLQGGSLVPAAPTAAGLDALASELQNFTQELEKKKFLPVSMVPWSRNGPFVWPVWLRVYICRCMGRPVAMNVFKVI